MLGNGKFGGIFVLFCGLMHFQRRRLDVFLGAFFCVSFERSKQIILVAIKSLSLFVLVGFREKKIAVWAWGDIENILRNCI